MNDVLAIGFTAAGLECQAHDVGVTVAGCSVDEVDGLLEQLSDFPSSEDLCSFVANLRTAKYDGFVPEALLRRLWARANADRCRAMPALIVEIRGGSLEHARA